jgi:hypothetical protein
MAPGDNPQQGCAEEDRKSNTGTHPDNRFNLQPGLSWGPKRAPALKDISKGRFWDSMAGA